METPTHRGTMAKGMKPGTWRELVEAAKPVYRFHPTGGQLHVILDDENLEDYWLDSALNDLETTEPSPERDAELACAKVWRAASMTQRRKAARHYGEYANG